MPTEVFMQLAPSIFFYPFTSLAENNCNTVIIDGPEKVIIDPGHKHLWPKLRRQIVADGFNPADLNLVIHTHCHPDHMEAGQILEQDYGAVQAMSLAEKDFYDGPGLKFFSMMGLDVPGGSVTRLLSEGAFDLGDKTLDLHLTPGHTPGGLCLHWKEAGLLVVGDLIFYRSYGRTDFPGGDAGQLVESIKRMSQLTGVKMLIPGHGRALLSAAEVAENFSWVLSGF
jgi:glyoxylase-like metal-dependent hydrolase (beta-lactamase superfamily II)